MPFHVNRWLSGAVTAASYYKNDKEKWSFLLNTFEEKYITSQVQNKFFKHKKNFEAQKNKVLKSRLNRKPTLIIIPDIANNERILKETNSVGIPALGLVNSNCNVEIAYPIFANDLSLYSVHFFCHFLSTLILKEFVKHKHKIATSRKNIRSLQFNQAVKDISRYNKRNFLEKTFTIKTDLKNSLRKNYEKKIQNLNADIQKNYPHETQNLKAAVRRDYKKKVSNVRAFVLKYFRTKAYKKSVGKIPTYNFKGKYYIEHFPKARRRIKRNIRNKMKNHPKSERQLVSPKKLISVENRKRLTKNKTNFYLKKHLLWKINSIKKLQVYNFSKIVKAIRLPENKPTFHYWNKRKFWFSKPIKFAATLPLWYPFKRYTLKSLMRRRIVKIHQKQRAEKRNFWKKNRNALKKDKYRKRWSINKTIKGNRK